MANTFAAKLDENFPHLERACLAKFGYNLRNEAISSDSVLLVNQNLNEAAAAHLPQFSVTLEDVEEKHAYESILHLGHVELEQLGR